jgi:hypothetical protein
MSTQASDFLGKTYAPAQSKLLLLLLLLLRKNPLQLSISQLSVKQESSLWQTAPKGILFLLFLLSV